MKQIITLFLFYCCVIPLGVSQTVSETRNLRSDTIDVLHYQIQIKVPSLSSSFISASCKVVFESKQNGVNGITLDLLQLAIDSIISHGSSVSSYFYNDTLLYVPFSSELNTGEKDSIIVYYNGSPSKDPSGFGGFYFKNNYAFNLGVGFEASPHNLGRVWHPCFDNFKERATYEITTITPSGFTSMSNGYIVKDSVTLSGKNYRHWKMEEEIPTYLACVGIANYTSVQQTYTSKLTSQTIPVMLGAAPADTSNMKNSFIHLFDAMDVFEASFGPYQWNKIGYALVPFNGGAMEHASCIMFPRIGANGSLAYETIMAHELAHHWWGNWVTCETAGDMWINEGISSYCEALFLEHVYDKNRAIEHLKDIHYSVLKYAHFDDGGYLPVAGLPEDVAYGTHVYDKGATVMHNLRTYMGDVAFFNGMKAILSDYSFSTINTAQFRDALTQATSFDATDFFDEYLFAPGFNGFEVDSFTVSPVNNNYKVKVYVEQKLFNAPEIYKNVPLQFTFMSADWDTTSLTKIVTGKTDSIEVTLPFRPQLMYLNKESKLLNAVTGVNYISTEPAFPVFDYAYISLIIKEEKDTSFLRIEHCRIPADPITSSPELFQYVISPDRYWKINGILSESFQAEARIYYNAENTVSGNLDNKLMTDHAAVTFTEDSLVLLWRPDAHTDWKVYGDYELKTLSDKTDGYGIMDINNLKLGEYAFAFTKSALAVQEEQLAGIKFYPNPAKKLITISFPKQPKDTRLIIANTLGKKVEEYSIKKLKTTLDVSQLPQGVYTLSLIQNNTVIASDKLIIKK